VFTNTLVLDVRVNISCTCVYVYHREQRILSRSRVPKAALQFLIFFLSLFVRRDVFFFFFFLSLSCELFAFSPKVINRSRDSTLVREMRANLLPQHTHLWCSSSSSSSSSSSRRTGRAAAAAAAGGSNRAADDAPRASFTLAARRSGSLSPSVRANASSNDTNLGKDFVESFFDVADFLAGASSFGTSELANDIGRDCYVDLNGWHLFLRDMKPQGSFHTGLANVVVATIIKNGNKCDERDVTEILKTVKVPLGGGKIEASLFELMPKRCVEDFVDIAKKYAEDM